MQIISVSHYKGKAYCIETDSNEKYYLHADIVSQYAIATGITLSDEKFAEIMSASYKRRAFERALYLLDYRDYSYIEIVEKLEKNYPESVCIETADRLAQLNLINDRRYAENLAEKYCRVKKYGIFRARQELMRHGISRNLADEILENYQEDVSERIYAVIEKKYARQLIENPDRKTIAKVTNALVRLGYGYDDIKKAVKDFTDENFEEDY